MSNNSPGGIVIFHRLQPKERLILAQFGPKTRLTRQQVSTNTGIRITTVSGRVTRLIDRGFLDEDGEILDGQTHRYQAVLRPAAPGQRRMF